MIRRRLYVEERMSRLAVWSLRTAVFALPVTAIGIGCYALEVVDLASALYTVLAGMALAGLALLLALAAFVVIWNEGLRGLGRVMAAGALALALIAPTAGLAAYGARLPVLYEVTTDAEDPPAYATLGIARSRASNPLAAPDEAMAEFLERPLAFRPSRTPIPPLSRWISIRRRTTCSPMCWRWRPVENGRSSTWYRRAAASVTGASRR